MILGAREREQQGLFKSIIFGIHVHIITWQCIRSVCVHALSIFVYAHTKDNIFKHINRRTPYPQYMRTSIFLPQKYCLNIPVLTITWGHKHDFYVIIKLLCFHVSEILFLTKVSHRFRGVCVCVCVSLHADVYHQCNCAVYRDAYAVTLMIFSSMNSIGHWYLRES